MDRGSPEQEGRREQLEKCRPTQFQRACHICARNSGYSTRVQLVSIILARYLRRAPRRSLAAMFFCHGWRMTPRWSNPRSGAALGPPVDASAESSHSCVPTPTPVEGRDGATAATLAAASGGKEKPSGGEASAGGSGERPKGATAKARPSGRDSLARGRDPVLPVLARKPRESSVSKVPRT